MRSMSPQIPFVATPKQILASGHGERHPPNERLNQTPICSTSYTRCCSLLNALIWLLCWLQQRHRATTAKFGHAQHILPLIKTSSVP